MEHILVPRPASIPTVPLSIVIADEIAAAALVQFPPPQRLDGPRDAPLEMHPGPTASVIGIDLIEQKFLHLSMLTFRYEHGFREDVPFQHLRARRFGQGSLVPVEEVVGHEERMPRIPRQVRLELRPTTVGPSLHAGRDAVNVSGGEIGMNFCRGSLFVRLRLLGLGHERLADLLPQQSLPLPLPIVAVHDPARRVVRIRHLLKFSERHLQR
mmetsp:Transcript_4368/g.12215  ORF Transcript_4368/g.12215 Transcript_4368/m.12215 type:complete len:212 (+) Transcript_4368:107-742(+)